MPIAADFERLIRNLRCRPTSCLGPGTYFVSLTFPDLSDAVSSGEEWTPPEWAVDKKGPLHSALEVRADLLKSRGEDFVLAQLAIVRRHSQVTSTELCNLARFSALWPGGLLTLCGVQSRGFLSSTRSAPSTRAERFRMTRQRSGG